MTGKYALALIERAVGKGHAVLGELQVAALELSETQHLQGFRDGKELIDLHGQVRGNFRQISLAVERRRGAGFHPSYEHVRRHMRQDGADPQSSEILLAPGSAA